jgi:hypothetical protein
MAEDSIGVTVPLRKSTLPRRLMSGSHANNWPLRANDRSEATCPSDPIRLTLPDSGSIETSERGIDKPAVTP